VWNQRLLMLCLLAGLIVAVGILSSIPLYADAVQHRLMQGELTEAGTHRPPFSFLWRYIGTWNGNIDREKYQPLDEYLSQQAAGTIGLPLSDWCDARPTSRFVPAETQKLHQDAKPLLWMTLGFISGGRSHSTD
jgi:putative ABC transport system permease protein